MHTSRAETLVTGNRVVNALIAMAGCEERQCPIPCQFICPPCMRMPQDQSPVDIENRFEVAMELAEIAWCPNLKISGFGSQAGRVLLTIEPGSR